MEARNPTDTEDVRKLIEDLERLGWYHSLELPSGEIIQGIQTLIHTGVRWPQVHPLIPISVNPKSILSGASSWRRRKWRASSRRRE